jgi:hypothetical protein
VKGLLAVADPGAGHRTVAGTRHVLDVDVPAAGYSRLRRTKAAGSKFSPVSV